MTLTQSQLTTLKAAIDANPTWAATAMNPDGYLELANLLNAIASPDFTVWKSSVSMSELFDNIVGESLINLAADKGTALNSLAIAHAELGYNPSITGNRDIFTQQTGQSGLFTGGATSNPTTRDQITALFKRLATEAEKILADTTNGDGSNATPANLIFEGNISPSEVEQARSS